jgi:hypothetical protein
MNPTETSGLPPCAARTPSSARTMRAHSSTVGASGFSHMTGLPAAIAARARSACVASCEAMMTASTSSLAMTSAASHVVAAPAASCRASSARWRSTSAIIVTAAPITDRCTVRT